ncbi:hypothetical protein CEXT_268321 [Caerostris extrusa]|uniref:Uncharacterized protein n=1 Tax=Caerostris extrusa TaxID=172846 RepID=A0AAV4V0P9_CAEEX|nr:hypothetical protein CEXT_268321 [Caerostris extrusa]
MIISDMHDEPVFLNINADSSSCTSAASINKEIFCKGRYLEFQSFVLSVIKLPGHKNARLVVADGYLNFFKLFGGVLEAELKRIQIEDFHRDC